MAGVEAGRRRGVARALLMVNALLALIVAFESRAHLVPERLIVGHAACKESSFLLTETPELVEIPRSQPKAIVHPLRGLAAGDRVWGLACLTDGSLWMLVAPRIVARIDRDGHLSERVNVALPRISLFGVGGHLLVQQLPIVPGVPALIAAPPRDPQRVRPWPGLVTRTAPSREEEIRRNFVNCGLPLASWAPCWFANENRVVISDGRSSRSLSGPRPSSVSLDRDAPIWDVALAASRHYWLLATTTGAGQAKRRVGGRLFWAHEGSAETASLDLNPPARLIVWATPSRCVLLTVRGSLMEVAVSR